MKEVPLKRHRTDPSENIEAELGVKGFSGAVLVMVKNRLDTQKCTSGRVLKTQTAVGVVAAREKRPKSCLCSQCLCTLCLKTHGEMMEPGLHPAELDHNHPTFS